MTGAASLRLAATDEDIGLACALFVEYAQWLAVDLCFQGFEEELATLPLAQLPCRRQRRLVAFPVSRSAP